MLHALVLASAVAQGRAFLHDFAGTWTCGNARYHETWRVGAHAGPNVPGVTIADVAYGDASHPDGRAFVYYEPSERAYHYDDFHADGSQSHLTSPPPQHGTWTWTGTYDPIGKAPDHTVDVTWALLPNGTIARRFAQRIGGNVIVRGSDRCTRTGATP